MGEVFWLIKEGHSAIWKCREKYTEKKKKKKKLSRKISELVSGKLGVFGDLGL
jgi:hypothetical protein